MRALFITTETVDCANHVRAWNSFASSDHMIFNPSAVRNDWMFLQAAEANPPDVIFYIGANMAPGLPRPETFRSLRKIAPTILLCSDAADKPWHPVLAGYRSRECFDLYVALDGAKDAPVDLATLTPIDSAPFRNRDRFRDIRCGFSGSRGRWNNRSELVNALDWFGGLTVRARIDDGDNYADHVAFLMRCRMVFNTSWTGTQQRHHVKGRVLEAGWAGAALLEQAESPIREWFPKDCFLTYRTPHEAREIIADVSDYVICGTADRLAKVVREKYSAAQIYGQMLEMVGVDYSKSVAAE